MFDVCHGGIEEGEPMMLGLEDVSGLSSIEGQLNYVP